jgi:hypothetical protein
MRCPRCHHDNAPAQKFCGECGARLTPGASASKFDSPETYTPKHLAERILSSKSALEGERKQVTVLFADLKGSMELLADRDPEDARNLLDPVLEKMIARRPLPLKGTSIRWPPFSSAIANGVRTKPGRFTWHKTYAILWVRTPSFSTNRVFGSGDLKISCSTKLDHVKR